MIHWFLPFDEEKTSTESRWVKMEYFEEDVYSKKRPIRAEAEGGAPKKARVSYQHQPNISWQSLPDVVFSDVRMMLGLENLHDLHKCRQVCQSWNVMSEPPPAWGIMGS